MDNLIDSDDDIYDWKEDPDKKNEAAFLDSSGAQPNAANGRNTFNVVLDHPYSYNLQENNKQPKNENAQLVFKNVQNVNISKISIGAPHCKWIDIHVPDFPEDGKKINYENESIVDRLDGGLDMIKGTAHDEVMSLTDAKKIAGKIHQSMKYSDTESQAQYKKPKSVSLGVNSGISTDVLHRTFNLNQMKIFIKMKYIWPGYKLLHKLDPKNHPFDWTSLDNSLIEVYPENKLFKEYHIPDFSDSMFVLGDNDEEVDIDDYTIEDGDDADEIKIKIIQQHFFTCEFSITVDLDRRTGR